MGRPARPACGSKRRGTMPLTSGRDLWHIQDSLSASPVAIRATSSHARTQATCLRDAQPLRRPSSRSADRIARGADLPDHLVPVPGHRPRRRAVQPGALGASLLPHFQSHRRGAGGAACRAGERRRRGVHRKRHGRAASRHRHHPECRRSHRRVGLALWRLDQPADAHAAALRHHHHVRQAARPRRLPRRHPAEHPAGDRRDHRQPGPRSARHSEGRGHRA